MTTPIRDGQIYPVEQQEENVLLVASDENEFKEQGSPINQGNDGQSEIEMVEQKPATVTPAQIVEQPKPVAAAEPPKPAAPVDAPPLADLFDQMQTYQKHSFFTPAQIEAEKANQDHVDSQTILNITRIYNNIVRPRRWIRVILHCCSVALIFALFVAGYIFSIQNYTWESSSIKSITNVEITGGNCIFNFYDSSSSKFTAEYSALASLQAYIEQSENTKIKAIETSDKITLQFISTFEEIRLCMIDIHIPKDVKITNFKFNCVTRKTCLFIHHGEKLSATKKIEITGGTESQMEVNIANTVVPTFDYYSEGGVLYLNHLLATTTTIYQYTGPVVIQTSKPLTLQFLSGAQAYCAWADVVVETLFNCYIPTDKTTEKFVNSTSCTGYHSTAYQRTLNMCKLGSACKTSQSQKVDITSEYGSIYVNLISAVGQPVSDVAMHVNSYIFDELDIGLDFDTQTKLTKALSNTFTEADYIYQLNVGGSYLTQQSQNTYWAFFSNPAYGDFKPWWLATLSAGLLTAQTFSLQLQLLPGFCPYKPVITLDQVHVLSQFLESKFDLNNSQVLYLNKDNRPLPSYEFKEKSYPGVEPLSQKTQYETENWYRIKLEKQKIITQNTKDNYNPFFLVCLILSAASALIVGCVSTHLTTKVFALLQMEVYKASSQFMNYANSDKSEGSEKPPDKKDELIKDFVAILEGKKETTFAPMIYTILSYYIYLYRQQSSTDSARIFLRSIFNMSNAAQTERYHKQTLDEQYYKVESAKIKERYERFCFYNHLTITPLSQAANYMRRYGYEIGEKESDQRVFVKLKQKKEIKIHNYGELSEDQKNSADSLELFFFNTYDVTGITTDLIPVDQVKEDYKSFCGSYKLPQDFVAEEVAKSFNILVQNEKQYELRISKEGIQGGAMQQVQMYKRDGALSQMFGNKKLQKLAYIAMESTDENQTEVYVIQDETRVKNFYSDPINTLTDTPIAQNYGYYGRFRMILESLRYNILKNLSHRFYKYRLEEDENLLAVYFHLIYQNGWFLTDLTIIIGNLAFSACLTAPIIYAVLMSQISYSSYSLYDPRDLIFDFDVKYRPWYLWNFTERVDSYVVGLFVVVIYYSAIAFLVQLVKYQRSYFPEDIGFTMEVNDFTNWKALRLISIFQWIFFLIMILAVTTYIGIVFVWLLLGAIINPNNFLVYASSAATFVTSVSTQYKSMTSLLEKAIQTITDIAFKFYLQQVNEIASSLMKEGQNLLDSSSAIVNSSLMKEAQKTAESLGFGQEIKDLCQQSQNMLEGGMGALLDADQKSFKDLKEKFIQKASSAFRRIAVTQYKLPEQLADGLIMMNFQPFDEVIEQIAVNMEYSSNNNISASMILWLYHTLVSLAKHMQSKSTGLKNTEKQMDSLIPAIQEEFLNAMLDTIFLKLYVKDSNNVKIVLKDAITLQLFHENNTVGNEAVVKQLMMMMDMTKKLSPIDDDKFIVLEKVLEYLYIVLLSPSDFEEVQQKLIVELLELMKFDQDIGLIFQMLFSTQFKLRYSFRDYKLDDGAEVTRQLVKFQQKYIPIPDPVLQKSFEQKIVAALNLKRFTHEPKIYDDIVQTIIETYKDKQPALFKVINKFWTDNKEWMICLFNCFVLLGGRNWKTMLKGIIDTSPMNKTLCLDILYMSSQVLWNMKNVDFKQSDEEKTGEESAEAEAGEEQQEESQHSIVDEEYEYEESQSQNSWRSEGGGFNEINDKWAQKIWKKKISSPPQREQKLLNRGLIKVMAKALVMGEEELIGFISILKAEITTFENTVCIGAFYNYYTEKVLQIDPKQDKANFIKTRDELDIMMYLFSCKEFERILSRITNLPFEQENLNSVIKCFFDMALATQQNYQIFGAEELKKQVKEYKNDELIEYFKELEGKLQQPPTEQELQIAAFYKSEQVTFYAFIKRAFRGEVVDTSLKKRFRDEIYYKNNMYGQNMNRIYLLLDLQNILTGQINSSVASVSLNVLETTGLQKEPFQNLLKIVAFREAEEMLSGIQYFITKQEGLAYKGFNTNALTDSLHKLIQVEKYILTSIKVPYDQHFIVYHLERLFLNNLLGTDYNLKDSSCMVWIRTGLKYLQDLNIISQEELDTLNPYLMIIFEDNPGFLKLNFENVFNNCKVVTADRCDHHLGKMVELVDAIANSKFIVIGQFLQALVDQELPHAETKYFFKKVTAFLQGLNQIDDEGFQVNQEEDEATKVKVVMQEWQVDLDNLVWLGKNVKNSLGFELDTFSKFASNFLKRLFPVSYSQKNLVEVFLTIFSDKPSYDMLSKEFKISSQLIQMSKFITQLITCSERYRVFMQWMASPSKEHIIKQFKVLDLESLMLVIKLLDRNLQLEDIPQIIQKLKLGFSDIHTKFYKSFFAFRAPFTCNTNYQQFSSQYKQLRDIRKESLKGKPIYDQYDTLDIYLWFQRPYPMHFLNMALNNPQLSNIFSWQELKSSTTIEKLYPMLTISAIVSYAKNDKQKLFEQNHHEEVSFITMKIKELQGQKLEYLLQYLSNDVSQNDLTGSFALFSMLYGINPLLLYAIQMSTTESTDSPAWDHIGKASKDENLKIVLSKVLKLFNNWETLTSMDRLQLMELEFINEIKEKSFKTMAGNAKAHQSQYSSIYKQAFSIAAKKLTITDHELQIVMNFLKSTSSEEGTFKLQKRFPLTSLIVCFALKELRSTVLVNKYVNELGVELLFLKSQTLIDVVLSCLQKFLYLESYSIFQLFDKESISIFMMLGIFQSKRLTETLKKLDFIKLMSLQYPNMNDPHIQFKYVMNKEVGNTWLSFGGFLHVMPMSGEDLKKVNIANPSTLRQHSYSLLTNSLQEDQGMEGPEDLLYFDIFPSPFEDLNEKWTHVKEYQAKFFGASSDIVKDFEVKPEVDVTINKALSKEFSEKVLIEQQKDGNKQNRLLTYLQFRMNLLKTHIPKDQDEVQKAGIQAYSDQISNWFTILSNQIKFDHLNQSGLITNDSNTLISNLRQEILDKTSYEAMKNDIRIKKSDQLCIMVIKYFDQHCDNFYSENTSVEWQEKEELELEVGGKPRKDKDMLGFNYYVRQISSACIGQYEDEDPYVVLGQILFNSIHIDDYGYLLSYYIGETDYKLAKLLIRFFTKVELEKAISDQRVQNLKKRIPAEFRYASVGDTDKSEAENETLLANSRDIGDHLETILASNNSISEKERPFFKLMVRAYLGDIEAWYSLLTQFRRAYIKNPLSKQIENPLFDKFLFNFLMTSKHINPRNSKISKSMMAEKSFFGIVNSSSKFEIAKFVDGIINQTLNGSNLQYQKEFLGWYSAYLTYTQERKIDSLTPELLECIMKIVSIGSNYVPNTTEREFIKGVLKLVLFLNFYFVSKINPQTFEALKQTVLQIKLVNESVFKLLIAVLNIQRASNLEVLMLNVLDIIQDHAQLEKHLPIIYSAISLDVWCNLTHLKSSWAQYSWSQKVEYQMVLMKTLLFPVQQLGAKLLPQIQDSIQELPEPARLCIEWCSKQLEPENLDHQQFRKILGKLNETIEAQNTNEEQDQLLTTSNIYELLENVERFAEEYPESHLQEIKEEISNQLSISGINPTLQAIITIFIHHVLEQGLGEKDSFKMDQDEGDEKNPLEIISEAFGQIIQQAVDLNQEEDEDLLVEKGQVYRIVVQGLQTITKEEDLVKKFKPICEELFHSQPQLKGLITLVVDLLTTKDKKEKEKQLIKIPGAILDLALYGDEELQELKVQFKLDKYLQIAQKFLEIIDYVRNVSPKEFQDSKLLALVKPILTLHFPAKGKGENLGVDNIVALFEGLIYLKNKDFTNLQPEFFQVFQMSNQNSKLLVKALQDLQKGLKSPQDLISEKLSAFTNPTLIRQGQYLSGVASKLGESKDLSIEDLFKLVDKDGSRKISSDEFQEFLRRTGLEISNHKLKEIFISVKGQSIAKLEDAQLDLSEFQKCLNVIQSQTTVLSLDKLGISKELLMKTLIVLSIYLLILIAFIIIGIQAFTVPGTFGSIINSILPALGGTGLTKSSSKDPKQIFDISQLEKIVKQSLKMIQSVKL